MSSVIIITGRASRGNSRLLALRHTWHYYMNSVNHKTMNSIQHHIDVLNDELLRMENEIKKRNLVSARKLVVMAEKLIRYGQAMGYYVRVQEEWNKREMEE